MELQGRTALITGGARRLGRRTALALAEQSASVVIHYRTSDVAAEEVADEVRRQGGRAWLVQADLASEEEAGSLVERSIALAGPVHLLVNNVSLFDPSTLDTVTLDEVQSNMAVNAWAPFALIRAVAAQGIETAAVNLLDTRIRDYDWNHAAYILSKHVLSVLTRMCALKYAPGMTVNAVAPGLVLPPPGEDDAYLERVCGRLPLRRHGSADDVAAATLFLLSSRFITGQTIYVDGGAHLRGANEWTTS